MLVKEFMAAMLYEAVMIGVRIGAGAAAARLVKYQGVAFFKGRRGGVVDAGGFFFKSHLATGLSVDGGLFAATHKGLAF
jgi:hypothetical protein